MKIIIEGAGEVGSHLAKMLRVESNEVTVIDNDPDRLERLSSYADVEAILGNPSSIKVLKSAGVAKADLFIAVYPFATQEVNIVGAMLARQLGAAKVIARINDEEFLSADNKLLFKEMGIELMFYPEKNAADEIVSQLKPRYRRMVELRFFEELSYEEIAERLNMPLGTVKAQLFRTRDLLVNILKNRKDLL